MYDLCVGDCLQTLSRLPADTIHAAVTSPPYFQQRNSQHAAQIGREATPEAFIRRLDDAEARMAAKAGAA